MTINVQVSCIKHSGGRDRHGHIVGIGGKNADGTPWYLPEPMAIQGMKDGKWRFYTSVNGVSVWVIREVRNDHEYLKTEADSTTVDNLLSLPPCP